jgi:hemerythrin-like domain-containing protein
MLRDKSLIPLSHQHQHALALCVRLERTLQAGKVDAAAWQEEIRQIFEQEISIHFAAEEKAVFPLAMEFDSLQPVVKQLLEEHQVLRRMFGSVSEMDDTSLLAFAQTLSGHIRTEERQVFEGLQACLSPDRLAALGKALEKALEDASKACIIPSEATRLRPRN